MLLLVTSAFLMKVIVKKKKIMSYVFPTECSVTIKKKTEYSLSFLSFSQLNIVPFPSFNTPKFAKS